MLRVVFLFEQKLKVDILHVTRAAQHALVDQSRKGQEEGAEKRVDFHALKICVTVHLLLESISKIVASIIWIDEQFGQGCVSWRHAFGFHDVFTPLFKIK